MKNLVIVSPGPVPNGKAVVVEGGGLRAWSLAEGLRSHGHNVKIAVPKSHFKSSKGGVFSYSDWQDIVEQVHQGDVIIANYAHGLTGEVFGNLPKSVLKIADAYVPIHVEVSARDDRLDLNGIKAFNNVSQVWLEALVKSDVILVANEEQKLYYTGMLFALKKLDPANYRDAPVLISPLGIRAATKTLPRSKKSLPATAPTILWWGGFYPWFDYQALPQIAVELNRICPGAKLKIAGAINPFVNEKSFAEPAEKTLKKLRGMANVEFVPWVPFEKRFDIFKGVDLILSLNNVGPETSLSWRTRYIDILEQAVPIATNGGDPFGEKLLSAGGGVRLTGSARDYARMLIENASSQQLFRMRSALLSAQSELTWSRLTTEISDFVRNPFGTALSSEPIFPANTRLRRRRLPLSSQFGPKPLLMFLDHGRRFGFADAFKKSITVVRQMWSSQFSFSKARPDLSGKGPLMLLHQLDTSGAPLVGLELARELKKQTNEPVTILVANIKDLGLQEQLRGEGFKVVQRSGLAHLPKLAGRAVVMNSAALPSKWIEEVVQSQTRGELASSTFFIHENEPQLFLDRALTTKIKMAQSSGLEILAVSKQQKQKIEILHGAGLRAKLQRLSIEPAPSVNLRSKLEQLDIVLVGPTGDNRKRQLDSVFAVALAQQKSLLAKDSRSINLTLIGLEDNFLGNEIRRIGEQILVPGTFRALGLLEFDKCLIELGESNVVVSLSENESFGLYIAQAMTQGAVVLRTPVGGHDETVNDGVNGFLITDGIADLAERLVLLSNKRLTPASHLLNMMIESKALIGPYVGAGYSRLANRILGG